MPTDTFRTEYGTIGQREVKSDSDIAAAQDKARLSSTAGSGLGSKGKSLTGAPKQEPNEDPAVFGARLRKWRESEAQRRAFSK